MSKDKNYGICHICGKKCELTFEHIPPKNALNKYQAKIYNGNELIKLYNGEPAKYNNLQQGMGKHSLCQQCNNITGVWYADVYCDIAKEVAFQLHSLKKLKHGDFVEFKFKEVPILAFLKQIITMFCSLLPFEEVKRLAFNDFLLDKESNKINTSLFDVRMYLTPIESGQILSGISQALIKKDTGVAIANVIDMAVYPFGFILNLNPEIEFKYGISIMELFTTSYNDNYNIELKLMYLERSDKRAPLLFKALDD